MQSELIHQLFHETAESCATTIAIATADRAVTYAELEGQSNRLANYLIAAGAQPGAIVAILADDRITIITAILGILKAGCVFCPLDVTYPDKRLTLMLAQVEAGWFITEVGYLPKVAALTQAASTPQTIAATTNVVCLDAGDDLAVAAHLTHHAAYRHYGETSYPAPRVDPDAICSIYFTSGSTGIPKAIAGRLKGIAHYGLWQSQFLGVGVGTRFSQLFSPTFDGFLMDVAAPLCAGGTVCIPPQSDLVLHTTALIEWLDQQQIHVLQCVPSIVRTILNENPAPHLFPALRYVGTTGEAILPADVRRWRARFGDRIGLINLYGPTETTITKFVYTIQAGDEQLPAIPIGQPMPGAEAILIDEEGKVVAPGQIGEILLRTPYRALGYYNQPALTRAVFIPNPQSNDPNDIVYRTGDLGYLMANGCYGFVGRKDSQLKIRGVRIELGEIESHLYGHPAVREAAVMGYADDQDYTYLCAYIVPQPQTPQADGQEETLMAALRAYLAERLPEAMTPSAFILLEKLPRTLTGKIDRRSLPSLQQVQGERKEAAAEPRTPLEAQLVQLWGELLKTPTVGVYDDFFAIGGHSLLAAQILTRIQQEFKVQISLRQLFEAPTVAGLASQIETLLWATQGVNGNWATQVANGNGATQGANGVASAAKREEGVL